MHGRSPLTLGSILVFFGLRHFAAHRSQFGCIIPDLGKIEIPLVKSSWKVPASEIRVLSGGEMVIRVTFLFERETTAASERNPTKDNQWLQIMKTSDNKKKTLTRHKEATREHLNPPYLIHVFCYINAHWWRENAPAMNPVMEPPLPKKGREK